MIYVVSYFFVFESIQLKKYKLSTQITNVVTKNAEICHNVFIARTIINNGSPYVRFLNLNDNNVTINYKEIEFEDLEDFVQIAFVGDKVDRVEKVLGILSPGFPALAKEELKIIHPLPRIDTIFDQLGNSRYFSVCDLLSGFHSIELEENSKKYTAFTTHCK